jgi:hypothetical protein
MLASSLFDGPMGTSIDLRARPGGSSSTASAHADRSKEARLVKWLIQGKHHYYALSGAEVVRALEGLSALAGVSYTIYTSH